MSEPWRKTYRPWEPQRYRQEAHSPDTKLPEGDIVFFLLDTVSQLDLRRFYASYEDETRGAPPFDPAMMVCLLLYAYCVGVFSSRKIAQACERNLAFLAIVGQERPDFRTISDFRKLHLEAFREVFVQVLRIAGEAGMVKLGNLATDWTKIQGNASRHKAMSYGYMHKEVDRLREDIEALVTQAYQQDAQDDAALGSRRGDELPAELARREARLATIEAAMRRLEARAKADADAERQRRAEAEAERQHTGTRRRGKAPTPVQETPDDKAQTNFTDPELQIMRTNNKGWEYCGNAQASVDAAYQIIVACDVTAEANDKQQAEPMAQLTVASRRMPASRRPRTPLALCKRFRPPMIAAITARRRPLLWSNWGLNRTWRRRVNDTMSWRPSVLALLPPLKSAWRRKCGHRKGGHCTRDAKSSWNRCLARSKKDEDSVDSCCAAWTTCVVNGGWCV